MIVFLFLGGFACNRHADPQIFFEGTYNTFLHGNLEQAQLEAARQYQRLQYSDPEWAWRFRLLEAKSLVWRGLFGEALLVLGMQESPAHDKNLQVETLALRGATLARLHRFPEAAEATAAAAKICQSTPESFCGDLLLAEGLLAVQQGEFARATTSYEQALAFARDRSDPFLRATALLNLGATSLALEHFDESIDWTEASYEAGIQGNFGNVAAIALANLGWAYYKLGDFDKSLELSLAAEKQSRQVGNVVQDLYSTTNLGYVYSSKGDLARAKQQYLNALGLASKTGGKEGAYNAQRALALVSASNGEVEEARKYSDGAIAMARADANRLNELYPLLVQGLIAARTLDNQNAESIFREVEDDSNATANLKWRSEYGLARLYEEEQRTRDADRAYRAALAIFENARFSLRRDQTRLPFVGNASQIYGDYITFLIAHGKSDDALRWADHSRARTLAEGLGVLPQRAALAPAPLRAQSIARRAGAPILFYWLGEKQSFLWAITTRTTRLFLLPPANEIDAAVQRYRKALGGPQDVLQSADRDGQWLYATLVAPAEPLLTKDAKVFVILDGSLNNLNFETLLAPQPKLHYWIEDATVINASSLRLLAASSFSPRTRGRNLLLIGNSNAPSEKYPELPKAALQMDTVAAHFPEGKRQVFARDQATPAAYLASAPDQFSFIHFVAHGTASRTSPLDSAIVLSRSNAGKESFKLYARDILQRPLKAELVTISSCYGAGERAYSGEGLVGLSWAFLRAGARNVIAALWEASDASTEQLMGKFYDEIEQGRSPDAALRSAKLALLHGSAFHNPFYWAPFQLYVGTSAGSDANRKVLQAGGSVPPN